MKRYLHTCMPICLAAMMVMAMPVSNGYAQAPAIEWLRCYGSTHNEELGDIKATKDGGYIITGQINNTSNEISTHFGDAFTSDIWVFKINANGAIEWEVSLGNPHIQLSADVVETADGGFVVGGTSFGQNNCLLDDNSSNIILVKLSGNGEKQWEKEYGGSGNEYLSELDFSANGGFLLTGNSTSSDGDLTKNNGAEDFWVVKTDASGNIVWQKSFGGSRTDHGVSAAIAKGGGYYIVGSSESTDIDFGLNNGQYDFLLLHLSESGELLWKKTFGGSLHDFAYSVSATDDGGAVIAGITNSHDGDVSGNGSADTKADIWVVKADRTGKLVWQKPFGRSLDEIAFDMQSTKDGGFLLCGITQSADSATPCTHGDTDIWVIKINTSGEMVWQKALGGEGKDMGLAIVENDDGSIIVGGVACSAGLPNYHALSNAGCVDILLVKLNAPGGSGPKPSVEIGPGLVCSSAPVLLSATAINVGSHPRYEWKRNGQVVGNEATYLASDFKDGDQVSCTVTPGGICDKGSAAVTASITLRTKPDLPLPGLSIDGPELLCPCEPGLFRAIVENGGSAPRYQWFVNDIMFSAGSPEFFLPAAQDGDRVHYRLLDGSACLPGGYIESTAILIRVPEQGAAVQIEGPAGAVCEGERVAFRALISGSADTATARWLVNGVVAAAGAALYETDSLHDGDRVSFTVSPNTECGGAEDIFSNEILVAVRPVGGGLLISTNSSSACAGEEMVFLAQTDNGAPASGVQWMLNGVAAAGATGSEWRTTYLKDGDIVSCKWSGGDFCLGAGSGSEGIVVSIYEPPLLTIYPADTIVNRGSSLQLMAQVSGEVSKLTWEPADKLSGAQSLNPVTVMLDRDIVFTLRIEDLNGCEAMATSRITVMGELFFPNAFSPNGDGHNDVFRGIFPGIPLHYELRIYNRLGQEVFATNDISKGWDGKLGGRPQGSHTYVWRCTYSQRGEPVRKEQGTVLLVR